MELLPAMKLGLWNGWVLVLLFFGTFGLLLLAFPRPVVARLYDRTGLRQPTLADRILELVWFFAWLAPAVLCPLKVGQGVFVLGMALYVLGFLGFVSALFSFAHTPLDQPVESGIYRISRHPQQMSLEVAFLGISIAIGSWIATLIMVTGIVLAHVKIVGEENPCLQQYGQPYRDYMARVRRYFLFF